MYWLDVDICAGDRGGGIRGSSSILFCEMGMGWGRDGKGGVSDVECACLCLLLSRVGVRCLEYRVVSGGELKERTAREWRPCCLYCMCE